MEEENRNANEFEEQNESVGQEAPSAPAKEEADATVKERVVYRWDYSEQAAFDREKEKRARRRGTALYAAIMGGVGILTWNAWYSVFVLLGQVINTLYMSCNDPQKVRKSVLVTCPMVLTYDVFVWSFGGVIYESVVIVSALIGIFRNRNTTKEERS